MIHSADITFQMLEDWRNVDLNSITKQTLYTMEDSRDEHRKLIIQCKLFRHGCVFVCLFLLKRRKGEGSWEIFKWHSHPVPPPLLLFLLNGLAQTRGLIDLRGHVPTNPAGENGSRCHWAAHSVMQKASSVAFGARHISIGGIKK